MIALQNEARLVEIRKTNGGHMKASFEEGRADLDRYQRIRRAFSKSAWLLAPE
jgi:hypothetical protein